ncbi:hypothetical protein AMATHDRAFT_1652 [Amanita thiersii Skay4041]|uniref:Methyltransferase domain-containing protein n=1 Tax=Amanita thiersii Skay4041 TaxID=703135 RepID=A0A2A9NU75_9AGAR|nr:hypothetical protein AMATHDRAFT_1652 [Amanita thiersii Skay4041]
MSISKELDLKDGVQSVPLDERLFSLDNEAAEFFKSQTGIIDDEELKKHILDVQAKAYRVYPYPCIRILSFLKLRVSRTLAYKSVLNLGQERNRPIFLDIGCCFGSDIRKVVADGWPIQDVVASDLRAEFWKYGHDLFRSTPDTFPAAFVPGDAFDPGILAPRDLFFEQPRSPPPDLKSLKSLNPLQGHVSAIHASSFFHLFSEEKQLELTRNVATLLSPTPGSIIFGSQVGEPMKRIRTVVTSGDAHSMLCHSPESWAELWNGQVFPKGTVHVETSLQETGPNPVFKTEEAVYYLHYRVRRL